MNQLHNQQIFESKMMLQEVGWSETSVNDHHHRHRAPTAPPGGTSAVLHHYSPIRAPRVNGLSFLKTMELLGLFPSKTFEHRLQSCITFLTNPPSNIGYYSNSSTLFAG